jgi:tetratricopeptide (TPR) repeat protein
MKSDEISLFISYSHEDTAYKDEIVRELHHLNRLGKISLWDDSNIKYASEWKSEIKASLNHAAAAILLVSNSFLSSEFCQEEEIPQLLRRYQAEGVKIYPIIVHYSNWNLYEWLRNFQLGPKDSKGRVKPLSALSLPKRKEFLSKLCEELYNTLARRAPKETSDYSTLDSTEDRERFARKLASEYADNKQETIKRLVESYKWLYQQGLDAPAFQFIHFFESSLKNDAISDESHRDILALLRTGFPIQPVHMKDLSRLDVETLVTTHGYPALMLGVRLSETKDPHAALQQLHKVGQEHRNMSSCALLAYALGQCHRKLGHLEEARGLFDLALDRINSWHSDSCECGPKCSRDNLLVETHRGYGAALRKLEIWDEAERRFKCASEHLTDQVSAVIKSDFLYSYGYYLYEQAIKLKSESSNDVYNERLSKAKELFEESQRLRPQWSAPISRLQIVKQLLGETDIPGYWRARQCAVFENGPESKLTAVLCGFGILTSDIGRDEQPDRGLSSQELYEEVEQELNDKFIPKATRACHAFDVDVICESRSIGKDVWLLRVYELLQASAKWNVRSIEEQRGHIKSFRSTHKLHSRNRVNK